MVLEKVKELASEQLGAPIDTLTQTTTFEEIAADPLELAGFIMAVEQAFDIDVPEEDVDNIKDLSDVVNYIDRKSTRLNSSH